MAERVVDELEVVESSTQTAISRPVRRARPIDVRRPSSSMGAVGQAREAVVQRLVTQRLLGLPLLGHVVEGEDGSLQLAVVADDPLAPRAPVAQLAVDADHRVLETADRVTAQQAGDRRIARAPAA